MLVLLPNGLLDGVDLFNYAEVDEIRGKQQNYLVDASLVVENIGHVPKILKDLVLNLQTKSGVVWKGNIEEAIEKLPVGDLETIFVKIRENTYGPRFYHEAKCEHCGHVNTGLKLELDKLELTCLTLEEMTTPKVLTLPKSGKEVELKPLYLKDLFEVIKITKSKTNALITSIVCTTVKRIGNKSPIKPEDLEDLPIVDLNEIQEVVGNSKVGEIDTLLQIDCKSCTKEFEVKLNVFDSNFFTPSKGSSNMNT